MRFGHCMKMFFSRISDDFKLKQLLPLKLLFFVHSSTMYVLYPYLTIHMRELGINVEETAIMSAVTPVIAIIMPPLAGMVADKIGNFKVLLSLFSALGGSASLLLLLVPVGRLQVTYPDRVILDWGCSGITTTESGEGVGYLELGLAEDIPCTQKPELQILGHVKELDTQLEACGFICQASELNPDVPDYFKPLPQAESEPELPVDTILKGRSYTVNVRNKLTNEVKIHHYNLTKEDITQQATKMDALSHRFLKHNPFFKSAVRRLSKNDYFFPAMNMYNLTCRKLHKEEDSLENHGDFLLPASRFSGRVRRSLDNDTETFDNETLAQSEDILEASDNFNCFFGNTDEVTVDDVVPMFTKTYQTKVTKVLGADDDFSMGTRFKALELNWMDKSLYARHSKHSPFMNATCSDSFLQRDEEITAIVHLHDPNNNLQITHNIELAMCETRCLATALRKDVCSNLQKEVVYDPRLTFWVYMVIRVFIGIIGGTAFAMFEGAVIAILREHQADYGLQRIYASIGGMISSPLSGLLIDYASKGKGYTDFRPAFYLYAGLKILGGLLMLLLNLEFKSGATNVVADVMMVLRKIEVIALMVACFVLGTAWGYLESFLFWLLQDLGGSRSLMGITITVGGIAGIPLLVLSGPIIDRIGHANVLFIGFIFYAIRLIGYSLIYNPWHCLFFEAMESITSSLSFTAAVTYAAKLSTTTTDSSVQGLLGGLYFGVGKGAGSLIGGYLMKGFGTRPTYQIFAVFTLFFGCIYYLFNYFYLRNLNEEGNDICKKEKKITKDEVVEIDMKMIPEKNQSNGTVNRKKTETVNNNATELKKQDDNKMASTGCRDNPAFEKDEPSKNDSNVSKEL